MSIFRFKHILWNQICVRSWRLALCALVLECRRFALSWLQSWNFYQRGGRKSWGLESQSMNDREVMTEILLLWILRKKILLVLQIMKNYEKKIYNRILCCNKLLRVIACLNRFFNICKVFPSNKFFEILTSEEIIKT